MTEGALEMKLVSDFHSSQIFGSTSSGNQLHHQRKEVLIAGGTGNGVGAGRTRLSVFNVQKEKLPGLEVPLSFTPRKIKLKSIDGEWNFSKEFGGEFLHITDLNSLPEERLPFCWECLQRCFCLSEYACCEVQYSELHPHTCRCKCGLPL